MPAEGNRSVHFLVTHACAIDTAQRVIAVVAQRFVHRLSSSCLGTPCGLSASWKQLGHPATLAATVARKQGACVKSVSSIRVGMPDDSARRSDSRRNTDLSRAVVRPADDRFGLTGNGVGCVSTSTPGTCDGGGGLVGGSEGPVEVVGYDEVLGCQVVYRVDAHAQ